MPAPLLTRWGLQRLAEVACGTVGGIPFNRMGLFTNNIQYGIDLSLADLTECALAGYARQIPAGGTAVITIGAQEQLVTYLPLTFTFAPYVAPQVTIYGWFTTESVTSRLSGFRLLSPSFAVPLGGGNLNVTLTLPVKNGT